MPSLPNLLHTMDTDDRAPVDRLPLLHPDAWHAMADTAGRVADALRLRSLVLAMADEMDERLAYAAKFPGNAVEIRRRNDDALETVRHHGSLGLRKRQRRRV